MSNRWNDEGEIKLAEWRKASWPRDFVWLLTFPRGLLWFGKCYTRVFGASQRSTKHSSVVTSWLGIEGWIVLPISDCVEVPWLPCVCRAALVPRVLAGLRPPFWLGLLSNTTALEENLPPVRLWAPTCVLRLWERSRSFNTKCIDLCPWYMALEWSILEVWNVLELLFDWRIADVSTETNHVRKVIQEFTQLTQEFTFPDKEYVAVKGCSCHPYIELFHGALAKADSRSSSERSLFDEKLSVFLADIQPICWTYFDFCSECLE